MEAKKAKNVGGRRLRLKGRSSHSNALMLRSLLVTAKCLLLLMMTMVITGVKMMGMKFVDHVAQIVCQDHQGVSARNCFSPHDANDL